MGVDVDPAGHGGAHLIKRSRVADPGSMVIDQIALELFDLLVCEHFFGKFPDAGIRPVHDLFRRQFFFQHRAAGLDPLERLGMQFDFFALPGDGDQLFNGQLGTIQDNGHLVLLLYRIAKTGSVEPGCPLC